MNSMLPLAGGITLVAMAIWVGYQAARTGAMARHRDSLWASMSAALRERRALAPQLTAIASLYIPWNDPLIEDVTEARKHAMAAASITEQALTEAELSWALARLMLAAEQRTELTRHADFFSTSEAIGAIEAKVAKLRLDYNRLSTLVGERVAKGVTRPLAMLTGIRDQEPFELDPLLARQAMMSSIQAGRRPRGRVA